MVLISDRLKTFGGSMMPLLFSEDIVYFKKISYESIRIDDIVVVKKNKKYFTHRVVYKQEKYLITKGDSNNLSDGKIYPKSLIGVVYKIKRERQVMGINDLYLLQSTLYFEEIVKVKKAFEKESIDFVFLKGLLLHLYFEDSSPKRIYRDCDILVAKRQFIKAKKTLIDLGYLPQEEVFFETLQKLKNREPEVNMRKEVNGINIIFDLHQEIVFMAQMTGLDFLYPQELISKFSEDLLAEKKSVVIFNENFPLLSNDMLLIYTALHLYHHNFVGPFRYELMIAFLKKQEVDFEKIADKIIKYKVKNFVYPCFLFLKKYYNVQISNTLMSRIQPDKKKAKYIQKIIRHENIFDEGDRVSAGIKRFENLFFLSQSPWYKKVFIFSNPQVLYSILVIFTSRVALFFNFLFSRN